MGGVDLADTRKRNFNATHIGLDQWWLNLLFYFIDFGTPNTLVIYILSINNEFIKISKFILIRVFNLYILILTQFSHIVLISGWWGSNT